MAETSRRVPSRRVSQSGVRTAVAEDTSRLIPEEVPVALVYDGSTHAVMMATPADLEDFAVGFSITEGVVAARSEIRAFEVVEHEKGLEARMWLVPDAGRKHTERRRRITGPTACGLCGVESLDAALILTSPFVQAGDNPGRIFLREVCRNRDLAAESPSEPRV